MGWEIYPQGLYDFLIRTRNEYTGDLPLFVTENGMADSDPLLSDGTVPDPKRLQYLKDHLAAARRAISDGVPLQGYMLWSLMDNYEWAYGYEERFGLVHVDFDSLKRTPKASYHALASALVR
jgi:beta-glucosidase